jgi:hypothetical protein
MTENQTALEFAWQKGQVVRTPVASETSDYYYKTKPGEDYVITRVYKNRMEVRGNVTYGAGSYRGADQYRTVTVLKTAVVPADGTTLRRLGEKPKGDYISPDDPRVAWIFEDAATLAKMSGLCSDYDRLTAELGIPGRERSFTVNATVKGLPVAVKVKARSRTEAEALVKDKLGAEEVSVDA